MSNLLLCFPYELPFIDCGCGVLKTSSNSQLHLNIPSAHKARDDLVKPITEVITMRGWRFRPFMISSMTRERASSQALKAEILQRMSENGTTSDLHAKYISLAVEQIAANDIRELRPYRTIPSTKFHTIANQIALQYLDNHNMKFTLAAADSSPTISLFAPILPNWSQAH
jgi:hypothetical protein